MHQIQKAFTLVELIIAIAIMGILSGVAVMSVTSVRQSASSDRNNSLKQGVQIASNSYFSKNGKFPCKIQPGDSGVVPVDFDMLMADGFLKKSEIPDTSDGKTLVINKKGIIDTLSIVTPIISINDNALIASSLSVNVDIYIPQSTPSTFSNYAVSLSCTGMTPQTTGAIPYDPSDAAKIGPMRKTVVLTNSPENKKITATFYLNGSVIGTSDDSIAVLPDKIADSDTPIFINKHLEATYNTQTGRIVLQWSSAKDENGIGTYEIYRSVNSAPFQKIDYTEKLYYEDRTISSNGTYLYKIRAVDSTGDTVTYPLHYVDSNVSDAIIISSYVPKIPIITPLTGVDGNIASGCAEAQQILAKIESQNELDLVYLKVRQKNSATWMTYQLKRDEHEGMDVYSTQILVSSEANYYIVAKDRTGLIASSPSNAPATYYTVTK